MIKRKYANMRIYDYNIDFEDVENTITYSLSAKNLENNLNKREDALCNKISDLEAKLAESETDKKALISDYENRITKHQELMSWLEHNNEELKQQLAEKDAEIRVVYSFRKQKCDNLQNALAEKERQVKKLNLEAQKYFEDAYCNDSIYQDKISFAVDILEELADCSNYINSKLDFESGSYVSEKSIRDKIKYLKGKKDE